MIQHHQQLQHANLKQLMDGQQPRKQLVLLMVRKLTALLIPTANSG
jgi:hypothetical protein